MKVKFSEVTAQDFLWARERMVQEQAVARGIEDIRVIAALRKIPRHLFVDAGIVNRAYDDSALPIGEKQTLSQPYMTARMVEALALGGDEKVLEIGTGSGYQTALLAELCFKKSGFCRARRELFWISLSIIISHSMSAMVRSAGRSTRPMTRLSSARAHPRFRNRFSSSSVHAVA